MQRIFHLFTLLLFISQAFSMAGFGLNLNKTFFSVDAKNQSDYGYEEFNGGYGLGGYLYIDAIPFIDLDLEFNGFGTTYDFFIKMDHITTNYSLPFGSLSYYLSMQKKLFQFKIPLLAKAKFTAGAGLNYQKYQLVLNESDLVALIASPNVAPTEDALIDLIKENTNSVTGFHIQTGLQFKLLMLDSFLYYRHVFAEDVIPDTKGFGSMNLRLGMGF